MREFAEAEIAPHVMEWDETQHFPIELKPKLAELGLMGVLFPEEYGGAGMGYVEYATIIEELSRVDGSVGISIAAHNSLCSNHIYQYGNEAQKQKYLVPLARGERLGAWGLTEPGAGSDASGTRTTAVRNDGGWVVNGSKNFITHAIHGDTCVAFASNDRSKHSKGITAFVFEKGMKGFSPSKKENKLGLRASETASVVFEDCQVPDENRLGEVGQGFVNAMEILDGGRISIAALAVGIAQGAYESAVRYSQERQQFGKPISEFQAVQFKLADMGTQIDAARLLMYRAAWMKDEGKPLKNHRWPSSLLLKSVCGSAKKPFRCMVVMATPRIIRRKSTGATRSSAQSAKALRRFNGSSLHARFCGRPHSSCLVTQAAGLRSLWSLPQAYALRH